MMVMMIIDVCEGGGSFGKLWNFLLEITKYNVLDFKERNVCITEKLLHKGFRYHKLVKSLTKFYHRYKDIIRKYSSTCRLLKSSGISHPIFYGNILYNAQKCQYSPQKLTKPLNRLNRKKVVLNKKVLKFIVFKINK